MERTSLKRQLQSTFILLVIKAFWPNERSLPNKTEQGAGMPEQIWLTYRELGERLGISPDGARMKAKRNKWTATTDNEGSIRVCVPDSLLANRRTNLPARTTSERSGELTNEIKALQAHIETLKQQVSDHAADRERLLTQLERQRADNDAALNASRDETVRVRVDAEHIRGELDRERDHARELASRLDTVHRAHGDEAARLRQEIAVLRTELARPWWRRLIGR
jgi:hypothetical protein